MCGFCGGSVCVGTGGCHVVVQQGVEVMRITYSQAPSFFGSLWSGVQAFGHSLVLGGRNLSFSFLNVLGVRNGS
jgi:hypothetical protein